MLFLGCSNVSGICVVSSPLVRLGISSFKLCKCIRREEEFLSAYDCRYHIEEALLIATEKIVCFIIDSSEDQHRSRSTRGHQENPRQVRLFRDDTSDRRVLRGNGSVQGLYQPRIRIENYPPRRYVNRTPQRSFSLIISDFNSTQPKFSSLARLASPKQNLTAAHSTLGLITTKYYANCSQYVSHFGR